MSKTSSNRGTHFILVHGAAHGAWCWYRLRSLLECTGHKVTCPDLRGSGIDRADPTTISTFEEYNQPLDDILSGLPEGEKVILVGHSAGGFSLTAAIHKYPHKLLVAVFAGAIMCKHGFADLPMVDDLVPDDYPKGENIRENAYEEFLYQLSPIEDRTLAAMLIRPSPSKALRSAKFVDGKDVDKVPRVYIRTLHDRELYFTQEKQDLMIKNWPPHDVYEIDSDHFLMFSNPLVFFGLLLKIADDFEAH